MTHTEAVALAVKITQSWPTMRIKAEVWAEDIEDLDIGHATAALVDMRRHQTTHPTIADYRAAVESRTPRTDPQPITPTGSSPYRPTRQTDPIGFAEHMTTRANQARMGNTAAQAELETWTLASEQGRLPAVWADDLERAITGQPTRRSEPTA